MRRHHLGITTTTSYPPKMWRVVGSEGAVGAFLPSFLHSFLPSCLPSSLSLFPLLSSHSNLCIIGRFTTPFPFHLIFSFLRLLSFSLTSHTSILFPYWPLYFSLFFLTVHIQFLLFPIHFNSFSIPSFYFPFLPLLFASFTHFLSIPYLQFICPLYKCSPVLNHFLSLNPWSPKRNHPPKLFLTLFSVSNPKGKNHIPPPPFLPVIQIWFSLPSHIFLIHEPCEER